MVGDGLSPTVLSAGWKGQTAGVNAPKIEG
jgi:hypothetical protein